MKMFRFVLPALALVLATLGEAKSQAPSAYPPFDKVIEGFKKIEAPPGEPPSRPRTSAGLPRSGPSTASG